MSLAAIERLIREWNRLRNRYGISDSPPEIDRLQLGVARRRARIRHLRSRIEELSEEVRVLEGETLGLEKALGLILGEAIHELRAGKGEVWSPSPVLGFRVWVLEEGFFHGYRERWDEPEMSARCPTTGNDADVPHTDGRCGEPPCGIYAAKDVEDLLTEHANLDLHEMVVGLVGMTGKVVEHERGYRAEHMSVLALAVPVDGEIRSISDETEIASLFTEGVSEPDSLLEDWTKSRTHIVEFMKKQMEVRSQWTLASPSG